MSFPMPESDSAFSLEKTNRLRGMLIVGIFIFHFCGMFPYEIVPGVGHLLVGAFFMLSGFGLMESFKNKKNYLDDFIGKKTARLLVPVWIAGLLVLVFQWFVFDNHSILNDQRYLFDIISGGPASTTTWFVVELIFFYMIFYVSFKYLKPKPAIVAVTAMSLLLMALLSQQQPMWYGSGMMFPVGIIWSYYRDKIESVKPHGLLIVSICATLILTYAVSKYLEPAINNLIYGNLQCLLVGTILLASLVMRKNNIAQWLAALLLCNIVYYASGVQLGHLDNLATILPLITILSIVAGLDILSPMTDFMGEISYEFYIIHGMMILVSKAWFPDLMTCLISSFVLSLVFAFVIKRVSNVFFDSKKRKSVTSG